MKREEILNKIRDTVCVWLGHSRIVNCYARYFLHCARCQELVCDKTAGPCYFTPEEVVVIGHCNCKTCRKLYPQLTWKDKFLVPYPFKKLKN